VDGNRSATRIYEMTSMNWNLDESGQSVTISFASTPPVALKLSTAEVENVLRKLGEFRSAMKPPVAARLQRAQKVAAVINPTWAIEPEMLLGNALLHLRDNRFGWLHFNVPREEARKIGEHLIRLADARPPGPAQSKPS
jgi:hypothetical protein